MSIIRTISEHAEKTGQLNSMVEILQYGMLEVAYHIVDHDPQKASAGRSSPASCEELIATLCILSSPLLSQAIPSEQSRSDLIA
jgi:hypothetical protein